MTSSKKKYFSIAPIKRMPFSRRCFDYSAEELISDTIQPGMLVQIPLRNKYEFGLVLDIQDTPVDKVPINKIKNIKEKVFEEPALSQEQLNFLKEISEIYFVSFNFLLKSSLIPRQKRKLKKETLIKLPNRNPETPLKPVAFFPDNKKEQTDYLIKNISSHGQTLILLPTVSQLVTFSDEIKTIIKNKTVLILSGEESEKNYFSHWLTVRNTPNLVVIGTRRALFLPWIDLQATFILDEGNFDYKSWDMAPRFQTRDAVLLLNRHFNSATHFISSTPSVETYFFAKNKIFNFIGTPLKPTKNLPWITDVHPEKQSGNFTGISHAVIEKINDQKRGDIFLFLNRRGTAHTLFCRNCKKTIRCPKCDTLLSFDEKTKTLNCPVCDYQKNGTVTCPICQSPDILWLGLGTTGIKKILKQSFGERYDIIISEKDNEEVRQDNNKKDKIIIGTKYAFTRLNWKKIKLVAFLESDASLYFPEYKIAEDLWQTIHEVSQKINEETPLILQTENPDHPVFAFLSRPEKFYNDQLTERKLLDYPPFVYILKLFYGAETKDKAKKAGEDLVIKLQKALTYEQNDVRITGPLSTNPERVKNLYFVFILVKINYASYKTILKKISQFLPEDWKSDPNPNKLLGF